MSEPTWKKLVEQLEDQGYRSPYLDRLRRHPSSTTGMYDLAAEIVREMALSLGRAEDKVNAALLALEVTGKALDALVAKGQAGQQKEEIRRRVEVFNAQRKDAELALWELRVHREALGFHRNADLADLYPIPPRRRVP